MDTKSDFAGDPEALSMAQQIHLIAGAKNTILFGSRARGDHRDNSDIDILIIREQAPEEAWLETLRDRVRDLQKQRMPQASGIDVICMTEREFTAKRHLRNNLANLIAKQGASVMPGERTGSSSYEDETIDWDDVENRLKDAAGAADALALDREAGIIGLKFDKVVGHTAQTALENAYKAVLAAHGQEYPTSGRDGHNLQLLIEQIRNDLNRPADRPVPGEERQYLTEFGGAALHPHEHPPLDKEKIANDIPQAVEQLTQLVENAKSEQR